MNNTTFITMSDEQYNVHTILMNNTMFIRCLMNYTMFIRCLMNNTMFIRCLMNNTMFIRCLMNNAMFIGGLMNNRMFIWCLFNNTVFIRRLIINTMFMRHHKSHQHTTLLIVNIILRDAWLTLQYWCCINEIEIQHSSFLSTMMCTLLFRHNEVDIKYNYNIVMLRRVMTCHFSII